MKGHSHFTRFGAPRVLSSLHPCSLSIHASPNSALLDDSSRLRFHSTSCTRLHISQGTLTPLLGIGVCVSIQFGALEYSKRFFAARNVRDGRGGPDGMALGSGQLFISGVFAGLANGVVSGPVEHIRIREQTSITYISPSLFPI